MNGPRKIEPPEQEQTLLQIAIDLALPTAFLLLALALAIRTSLS